MRVLTVQLENQFFLLSFFCFSFSFSFVLRLFVLFLLVNQSIKQAFRSLRRNLWFHRHNVFQLIAQQNWSASYQEDNQQQQQQMIYRQNANIEINIALDDSIGAVDTDQRATSAAVIARNDSNVVAFARLFAGQLGQRHFDSFAARNVDQHSGTIYRRKQRKSKKTPTPHKGQKAK